VAAGRLGLKELRPHPSSGVYGPGWLESQAAGCLHLPLGHGVDFFSMPFAHGVSFFSMAFRLAADSSIPEFAEPPRAGLGIGYPVGGQEGEGGARVPVASVQVFCQGSSPRS
jgi:hypothetical protein